MWRFWWQNLKSNKGWKLINNPTCLFAQVMKARYYPQGDFMGANLGSYPFFTWCSIWGAR
ncbi:RNA-directed DNA polymerase reverse transcriptase family protein [Gossypium australe]|uniref:RNA-directed DNA polymerase reverse transcriptase family protein n=1 Tax=Gossypium australe TaxID=47621 RepID=A0A5B6VJ35_9ROSI|nr:RNA-directed DNA polymerase reverse transcriptase family protein [Gossypium australe]